MSNTMTLKKKINEYDAKITDALTLAEFYHDSTNLREHFSPAWMYMLRSHFGLSQRTLAEYLGVTHTYISHIESGRRVPSSELIMEMGSLFVTLQEEEERDKDHGV